MIVLDASVVLKWIFDDEDGGVPAGRLKDAHVAGYEIAAVPDLLFYEIGNLLMTKTRLSEAAVAERFRSCGISPSNGSTSAWKSFSAA